MTYLDLLKIIGQVLLFIPIFLLWLPFFILASIMIGIGELGKILMDFIGVYYG